SNKIIILAVMTEMSKAEVARFLMHGTFTGKLATVKKDGSPHVVPIWFVVENGKGRGKAGNIILTTGDASVKANNIQHDGRVSICIDDQKPPFSFVTIHGTAKIIPYKQKEVLEWATKIAERYVGKKNAKTYGEENSGEGAVLVRIKPTKVIAEKDISILG
ncbi:MAG TPA: PPOX class F420-dependent oxidoreductase, partial [Nitrososphaeraceae archaeon]|nr:PPOX class F420-dependent oxidoreductase [Nitrososphaeraceae archaeon]